MLTAISPSASSTTPDEHAASVTPILLLETAVPGAGDFRDPVRPRSSSETLRSAQGRELAGNHMGRKARQKSC